MENNLNVKLLSMAGQGGSVFGIQLMELMKVRNDIIVLSADMSTPAGLDKFKTSYPDHFINVGIAEQNMIGLAAGLADEGFKVVCVAQACFLTMRCFEQVRQFAGYVGIPIVLVGIGSGLSLQYMGNTHYALEDIALMRTIPHMRVIAPCDSLESVKAFECAINENCATYIRLFGGTGIPAVHQGDISFECGKAISLKEGNDATIISTGSMVRQCLQAADLLKENGISCGVVDMHTIKPLDVSAIMRHRGKPVVVVEEHRMTGGLGSAVADILCVPGKPTPLLRICVDDEYPMPGSYNYMLKRAGLDAEGIASKIIGFV